MIKVQINLGVEAQTLSERDHAFSRDRHGYSRRDLGRDEFYYTKVLQRIISPGRCPINPRKLETHSAHYVRG